MKIEFKAAYGNEEKSVELSQPQGGSGGWFIMVDNYYLGQLLKSNFGWRLAAPDNTQLTSDDIMVLIERIENETDVN